MPASGKVSLTWQTIFVLIPVLDIIAFYRIKHLRKYLLIVYLLVVGVAGTIYSMLVTPEAWTFNDNFDPNFMSDPIGWLLQIPIMSVTYAISIFLVRRWSKQWNEKFT